MKSDADIVILYVEDQADIGALTFRTIAGTYSPASEWVRSQDAVAVLFETGFAPDLVIHDCSPLFKETDQFDHVAAGDQMYREFVARKLPVVVLSGMNNRAILSNPPYSADPPLGWVDKPVDEAKIRQAVELYKAFVRSRGA